jgi:hypothetical protein
MTGNYIKVRHYMIERWMSFKGIEHELRKHRNIEELLQSEIVYGMKACQLTSFTTPAEIYEQIDSETKALEMMNPKKYVSLWIGRVKSGT